MGKRTRNKVGDDKKKTKEKEEVAKKTEDADEIKRPKNIYIAIDERDCLNKFLYRIYRVFKILFISIWFYYLPIFVIYSGFYPVYVYRRELDGADGYVSNSCTGAKGVQIKMCEIMTCKKGDADEMILEKLGCSSLLESTLWRK